MRLRFIGADGSMELRNGAVYDVVVGSCNNCICVEMRLKHGKLWRCLYSSPKTFADNWEEDK